MTRRQRRAFARCHQHARLHAAMPLANQVRESYTKVVRATPGLDYHVRTTPPVLRLHERFLVLGLVLCFAAILVSCFHGVVQ